MQTLKTDSFSQSRLLIGFSCNVKAGQQWCKKVIDRPGAIFILRGKGVIFYKNSSLTLYPGDMAYYDALPKHSFRALDEWSYFFFHFPESMIEKWKKVPCNTEVPGTRLVHFEKKDFLRVNWELKEANMFFLHRSNDWENITEALLQVVLTRFFHLLPESNGKEEERLQPAIRNLGLGGKTKNMTELARLCGMSRTDFFRKFRSVYGCTPAQHRNNLLISQAKVLLCSTDCRIYEIAAQLRFRDCYYFMKFFKSYTGFTPSAWRRDNVKL